MCKFVRAGTPASQGEPALRSSRSVISVPSGYDKAMHNTSTAARLDAAATASASTGLAHGVGLGARTLLRDWRSGELRLLVIALIVAVAAVTSVGFLADRVGRAL